MMDKYQSLLIPGDMVNSLGIAMEITIIAFPVIVAIVFLVSLCRHRRTGHD